MLNIYLLITILTQLTASNVVSLYVPLTAGPSELSIEFENHAVLKAGTPVLIEGRLAGSIAEINTTASNQSEAKDPTQSTAGNRCKAVVKVFSHFGGILRQGTVALVTLPLTAEHSKPETVVELLIPSSSKQRVLQNGEIIKGFSSYAEFWEADLSEGNFEIS